MASGRSRRERLIETARQLKVGFKPNATDDQIRQLIDAAPATTRQCLILEEIVQNLGARRRMPANLTYGQARRALERAMEILNERAIQSMSIEPGMVRQWKGKYYYVVNVLGSLDRYMVVLQRVQLKKPASNQRAGVNAVGGRFRVNPVNMLYVSIAIDLNAWRPDYIFRPSVDPDEPLF